MRASVVKLLKMVLSTFENFDPWPEDVVHIKPVLLALLTEKPSKCMFGYRGIKYLAHVVGNGEMRWIQEKTNAINNITIVGILAFMSMANYMLSNVDNETRLLFCHFPKRVLVHIRIKGEVGAIKLV